MMRRPLAAATLLASAISMWACVIHHTERLPTTSLPLHPDRFQVQAVLCNNREPLQFPDKGTSGYVLGDMLVIMYPTMALWIPRTDIADIVTDKAGRTEVTTRSGRQHFGAIKSGPGTFVLSADQTRVPLSQVDQVWVRRVSAGKTFLATAFVSAVIGALLVIANNVPSGGQGGGIGGSPSCPFVYCFDGNTYVLDAEPYSGATAPGLKRTEWVGLQHLTETGGEYRLKVANELDETQYTDELRLLVVDHPRGAAVVPDERGVVHTVIDPTPPRLARDSHERSILPYVATDDWVYWHTRDADVDPQFASGVKESLVFEFPKPPGATRAKLVFNGGNTPWASRMLKRFLSFHGRNLPDYYASLNGDGPARGTVQAWALREELYRLYIRVLTKDGWVSKGSLVGGGPFVTEDRAYDLDVSDVSGDVLEVQLTPPVGFWAINYLGVDYSADARMQVQEVTASRARDRQGGDIRQMLAATDDRYFVMSETGDSADVAFAAPARVPGFDRTVLLKASGYYDIHMGPLGEPRLDLLARLITEPGFGARFAWNEYLAHAQAAQGGNPR